jgi:DNA (cytosine-5)-methyltransferase 1
LNIINDFNYKVGERYFLSDAVRTYVLKDGTKNWHQKVETDLPIARTLLKTMGNCHRAGVDNYITENGKLRMLTEREALRLMGYTDDFVSPVSIAQTYKQAGNSIVVDVMMAIVKYILSEKILEV